MLEDPNRCTFGGVHSALGVSTVEGGPPGSILLADDDTTTAEWLSGLLRRDGHRVLVFEDAESAVEYAVRNRPDLVLLASAVPKMGGVEACRMLKGQSGTFLPILLLLPRTDSNGRIECLRVGADDYLARPLEEREVQTRIHAMLRTKRLHDEVAAIRARLEAISYRDELTGLSNFRYLGERLTEEFRRSERYHEPLACLLIDVDGLRRINEAYGRPAGDQVLRDVGKTVRAALRELDIVARYGGDEVIVVLPSTHFAGALAAAERVWRDVRALSWPLGDAGRAGAPTNITLSIGISLFPSRDVRTRDQLIRGAETSLLRCKRDGGNGICVFQHQGYIYSPSSTQDGPPVRVSVATGQSSPGMPAVVPEEPNVMRGSTTRARVDAPIARTGTDATTSDSTAASTARPASESPWSDTTGARRVQRGE